MPEKSIYILSAKGQHYKMQRDYVHLSPIKRLSNLSPKKPVHADMAFLN